MAPIEPDQSKSNLRPLLTFGIYISATISLTALVCYDIVYKASTALPPSQDTRVRQAKRRRHMQVFGVLAGLSLATAWYHLAAILGLSYRVWAHERGYAVPESLTNVKQLHNLQLGRWLAESSPLSVDAWEIVAESSARFWWAQQLFLASAAWALYVALEGRRRQIRHLWAYVLLGPLVARSFAMNLFFLAVLSAPVPLPPKTTTRGLDLEVGGLQRKTSSWLISTFRTIRPYLPPNPLKTHPATWHPYLFALLLSPLVIMVCTGLIPYTLSTPTFQLLFLIILLAMFRPIYMDRLAPLAYGSTKFSPARIRSNHRRAYSILSLVSFLLFVKQTTVALLDSDPGAHRHRHSTYLARMHLPHEPTRSGLSRSSTAANRLFAALNSHPAAARLGTDVLLCALSLAVWAWARGLDAGKMAAAAGLPFISSSSSSTTSSTSTSAEKSTTQKRARKSIDDKTFQDPKNDNNDTIWRGEEEEAENAESGAVAGAMFAVGGLGVLASAVLGAEDI